MAHKDLASRAAFKRAAALDTLRGAGFTVRGESTPQNFHLVDASSTAGTFKLWLKCAWNEQHAIQLCPAIKGAVDPAKRVAETIRKLTGLGATHLYGFTNVGNRDASVLNPTPALAVIVSLKNVKAAFDRQLAKYPIDSANGTSPMLLLNESAPKQSAAEKAAILGVARFVEVDVLALYASAITPSSDAIDDCLPTGNEIPDRVRFVGTRFQRDAAVRKSVLDKAKGICECCNSLGFEKRSGGHYLEAHHLIALANDGKDTMENVVALCANCHRELHFGARSEEMERAILKARTLKAS